MTQKEIIEKIAFNEKLIEKALTPNIYTLNNEILRIDKEIDKLQKKCPHDYAEDGFCIYCDKEKIE